MKKLGSPLFILLLCVMSVCGAFLLWTSCFDWGEDLENDRNALSNSAAAALPQKISSRPLRQHLSRNPIKKRIDTKARLAALYEKYPDLKPDYPESDQDFSGLFDILFPESERNEIGKDIDSLEKELLVEGAIDEQEVRAFFDKHSWRVEKLVQHLTGDHHYKELDMSQKFLIYQLMSAAVGGHLALGNQEEVLVVNNAIEKLRQGSGEVDLLSYVLSNYAQKQVGKFAIQFAVNDAEFSLDLVSHQRGLKFIKALRGDFETVLVSYVWPEVNNMGRLSVSDELDIGIVAFEELFVDFTRNRLDYYNELFLKGGYRTVEQVEGDFLRYSPSGEYSEGEVLAYKEMSFGAADVHSYYAAGDSLKAAHIYAIEIAMGEAGRVPKNPMTGEDMVLDLERRVLITGLDGIYDEIKIPVFESE